MSKKSAEIGVGKKVLASALSAAMVVAFAPAIALAGEGETNDTSNGLEASQPESTSAAQIIRNGTLVDGTYETLNAAVTAAEAGDTIKLCRDLDENVEIAKAITLDLNGFVLNGKTAPSKATLLLKDNVTIDDSSEAKTGVIKREDTAVNSGNGSYYVIDIQENARVTFNSGTVENNSGTTSGTRKGASLVRIGDDSKSDSNPVLTVSGGTFTQDNFVALKVDHGTLDFENGVVNCGADEAIKNWDKATISGGKVNGAVSSWTYKDSKTNGVTTIASDAEVNGDVRAITYDGTASSTNCMAQVAITGGSVLGSLGVYQGKDIKNLTAPTNASLTQILVSGGTFTDIASAVKYAKTGSVVKLADNISGLYGLQVNKELTLDLNGKTITSDNTDKKYAKGQWPAIINVVSGGDLTITGNGKIVGPKGDAGASLDSRTLITVSDESARLTVLNGTIEAGGTGSDGMYGLYALNGGVIVLGDEATKTGPTINSHFAPVGENFTTAPANLTVYGGSYTASANPVKDDGSLEWWSYFCAPLYLAGKGKVDIQGGVFNGYYGLSTHYKDASQELNISGGQFRGTGSAMHVGNVNGNKGSTVDTNLKKIQITGGSFSSDPKDYVPSGYDVTSNDGIYTVSKHVTPSYPSGGGSVTPTPTPKPDPEPTPTPTPAAPGTNVSGTDASGNTVEATVTDNEKTTLPDGTEAAGSVEYKGTTGSGSSEPASSANIPASVTSSDGTVYAVTKIADDAFNGQSQLQSVSIPATVVEIGERAFAGTGISSVQLPAATSTIGKAAFKGCASLKTADISKAALTQIPADAFNGTSISSIDVPDSVKSIGARAFKGTKLKSLESKAKTVGKSAFAGCAGLKTVSLPDAVTLGARAFSNAPKLKTVRTGRSLKGIGPRGMQGSGVRTLRVESKKLTEAGVKNSLRGSKVTKVEVAVTGSEKVQGKYVSKYREMFKKSVSGKSVKVVKAKKAKK